MTNDQHNRKAWNRMSGPSCPWSTVSKAEIDAARSGEYSVSVAGMKPLPVEWLGKVKGKSVLCLAAGGGQQAPILAAAGATVTLLDISDEQLELDRQVCSEHSLPMTILQGTMADLSRFPDACFDMIVNPVSNVYVQDLASVWKACYRVLGKEGRLIAGSINPINFLFEENEGQTNTGLNVKYALPYVESETLTKAELDAAVSREMVFTWSHSLEEIIQGQLNVGFLLAGLIESRRSDMRAPSINRFTDTYISTFAIKQGGKK